MGRGNRSANVIGQRGGCNHEKYGSGGGEKDGLQQKQRGILKEESG